MDIDFFNELAPRGFKAESAGTQPAGRVHPNAIRVMEEVGIDIRPQRPKRLTREMIEKADRVITMGCGAGVCPAVFVEKVTEWALEDPTAGSIERFREVRDAIKRKVEEGIEEMEEEAASLPSSRVLRFVEGTKAEGGRATSLVA